MIQYPFHLLVVGSKIDFSTDLIVLTQNELYISGDKDSVIAETERCLFFV